MNPAAVAPVVEEPEELAVYKCQADSKSPYVYSLRKKCRYCTRVTGKERETALAKMRLPAAQ